MNFKGLRFYTVFFMQCLIMRRKIARIKATDEKDRLQQFQQLARDWMNKLWNKFRIEVDVQGLEHFPADGRCIVVLNHRSFLDIMLATTLVPFPNKTLAKTSGAKIPVFGKIWKQASILVDRDDDASRRQAGFAIRRALSNGITMIMFPEGKRNTIRHVPMLPMQDGAFEMAFAMKVPIVVGWIEDSDHVLPKGYTFRPGKVSMHFIQMLDTTKFERVLDCKKKVQQIMLDKRFVLNT